MTARKKTTARALAGSAVATLPTPRALMLQDLARSGLDEKDAKILGLEPLDAVATAALSAVANGRASYRIPYRDAEGKPLRVLTDKGEIDYWRLRLLPTGSEPRYAQPDDTIPEVYLPPNLKGRSWKDVLADPKIPLAVGEGEKKAACACKHGIRCLALGGASSFSSRKRGIKLIDGLKNVAWADRDVTIVFDADLATNANVRTAAFRLGVELRELGAVPRVAFLPAGGPKGIDDLIVERGKVALEEVIASAESLEWPFDLPIPPLMFPHVKLDAKGNPKSTPATIENVERLLDLYGVEVSYNVITKVPLYSGRGTDTEAGAGVQHGAADSALNRIVSQARLCGMAVDDLQRTVAGIAYSRPVNPVRDYLAALPPPGASEPDAILAVARKFVVPEDEKTIRDEAFRLWMIQACAAADYLERSPISERCGGPARPTFEYVLTLLGRQGVCKTSTLRALVPAPLREYFGAGVILNPDNKDAVERATGFWIAELGEIDGTVGKAAAASMKAFLSQTADVYRKSYGRERNSFPRQTVFAATGNILRSLRDITGSRRFWPVNVTAVAPMNEKEIERAWAQAWDLYARGKGKQWWPTPDLQKRLDAQVLAYAEEFPLGEKVLEIFGPLTVEAKEKPGAKRYTAFKIMEVVGLSADPKDPRDVAAARELGNWLARVNQNRKGEPDRIKRAGTSEWVMPPLLRGAVKMVKGQD